MIPLLNYRTYPSVVMLFCIIYSGAWYLLRPLGSVVLGLFIFVCICCLLIPQNLERARKYYKVYIPFFLVCIVYVIASVFDGFEPFRKAYFDKAFILQQSIGFIVLPLFVVCFSLYFEYLGKRVFELKNLCFVLFFVYVVFSLLGVLYSDNYSSVLDSFRIGTLVNAEHIALLFFVGFIFHLNVSSRYKLLIFVCLIVLGGSSQSFISIVLASALLFVRSVLILRGFVLLLFAAVAVSLHYPQEIYLLDANTGIRTLFWIGAIEDFINSFGFGVGFGTEAIAGKFYIYQYVVEIVNPDFEYSRYMTTATHNSYFDVMQRTGIVGLLMFSYITLRFLFDRSLSQFDAWVASTMILSLSVNVATSITFIFGSAISLGWLEYRRVVCYRRVL
jgi:hypothetical protein